MSDLKKKIKFYYRNTDKVFWLLTLVSSSYGLLLILSVSMYSSMKLFITQTIAISIGYIAALIIAFMDYRTISKYWYILGILGFLLMIYTIVFGWSPEGVSGNAWISIGSITFQPSELIKIFFMVTFGYHVSVLDKKNMIKTFKGVIQLALHALIPIGLVIVTGDDGTALVFIFMFLIMAFGAGVQARYFIGAGVVAACALPIIWTSYFGDYQRQRFLTLFNLEGNLQTYGWQQYQAKISIGSGQIFGRGLFSSPRVESGIVSVQESDFIFSVAGEAFGLIGCLLIIALLVALCVRCLWIAIHSKSILGRIICLGFFGMVSIQTIINLGMCLAVLPVIGITLPFFSSGGSSVTCLYLGVGLVESVYFNKFDENILKLKIDSSTLNRYITA